MLGAFYIAEIARSLERKKINSRVPRIISARFLKPTKKKGWLGERKKDEVARYAVSSVVRRSLEVTWGLPRWIVQATRGRAEVPVWWNGSRVIEILCSLPSRYDVRRGPHSYRFFLSLSLLAFSPSLSYVPLPSRLSIPFAPVISSSESSCYSFSRKDIRTRSRVTSVKREREQVGPAVLSYRLETISRLYLPKYWDVPPVDQNQLDSGNLGNSRSLKLGGDLGIPKRVE